MATHTQKCFFVREPPCAWLQSQNRIHRSFDLAQEITLIETYAEACQAVAQWGILPLSSFIPDHPSLDTITQPGTWHTGTETDPWLWRDRLAGDGIAAYGRFTAGKPIFVSRELFPLLKCLLN